MHECRGCGADWLEANAFTALCTSREERGRVAHLVSGNQPAPAAVAPAPPRVRYIACPACRKIMNRSNFGHHSGIIVSTCKGHGAWLEPGDLRRVLAFIDAGGLERPHAEDAPVHPDQYGSSDIQLGIDGSATQLLGDSLLHRALHQLFS